MEGIAVWSAGDPDPERPGRLHRRHLLDHRRPQGEGRLAGPYLITGQKLLVRADNTDITGAESLQNNKKLCSVTGSTPAQRIKDEFAGVQLQQYDTYSACISEALKNGAIDAVTTDEVILAGYAAQTPGAFKVAASPSRRSATESA